VIAKINRTATDLLGQVQDQLDAEKIRGRARLAAPLNVDTQEEGGAPAVEATALLNDSTVLYAPRSSHAKVLVVADSLPLRELLVAALRPSFHVLAASDGWEALQLMVERPDVIVAEVKLPQVEFVDMVDCARRIAGDVAVLAMHDLDDVAGLAAARQRQVQGALQKPFPMGAVISKVEALAALRQPQASKSVLLACCDPHEGPALHHLLDARYRTRLAPTLDTAHSATEDDVDVLIADTADAGWQEIVALYRERNSSIRVLALVDGSQKDMIDALKQSHVDAALRKPYTCDDLLAKLRSLLGIKEIDSSILRSVFRRGL
jgi:DNA-binding response OmpR family regulator